MAAFGLVVWWNDFHYLWHHPSGMEIKIGFDDNRINSVMYHPNLFAGFLVLALGCGLGLFHQLADYGRKARYGLGIAMVASALFLTASRAGWIGGTILLVGFGACVDRRWLVALLGGAGLAFAARPDLIVSRLAALSAGGPGFDQNRVLVWRSAQEMIRQQPFLGWGPGSWEWAYPHFRSLMETEGLPHAHNYYLHVAAEFGVPVVVTLMAIVAYVCWTGVRDTRHTQYHHPVLATVASVVGYLALNLFDYTLSEGRNAMAFFLLLGGVEAARRMAIADRPPELRRVVPAAASPIPEDPAK
jgi:O-antigen ligase